MRPKADRVKAQAWSPALKATVPFSAATSISPMSSSRYVAITTLTFSISFWNFWNMDSPSSWSSRKARSSLLMVTTGLIRSARAWRSTVSVCTDTPSTQSTTTRAPSVMRRAEVTSAEKSTCPGESTRLMRNSGPSASLHLARASGPISSLMLKYSEIPVDLMVMARAASSGRVSVRRFSPAWSSAMIPAAEISESVRVDFP
mmetsp:Transcript_7174/g.10961  ORF Transcript_7174/g.10961 Transcript_7174/m.10961 type:complete len:202 (-) Transcript_7174:166-771(-)